MVITLVSAVIYIYMGKLTIYTMRMVKCLVEDSMRPENSTVS